MAELKGHEPVPATAEPDPRISKEMFENEKFIINQSTEKISVYICGGGCIYILNKNFCFGCKQSTLHPKIQKPTFVYLLAGDFPIS